MPIPCCRHCYTKYIGEDDAIKEDFLLETFGPDAKVSIVQPELSEITRNLRARGIDVNEEVQLQATVIVGETETPLCMCNCHKDGWSVFH